MPATRPVWKGQIRLSLVSIPVEVFSATQSTRKISFRQIHEPSGKPVHYQKVVSGVGPVDTDDILKGFEYEKGKYVLLDEEDVEAVKLETRKTFDLVQFVGACEIEPIYFDKPYFVAPQDELAEEAFRVLRDALRKTKMIGLGQLAMRGNEHLAALKPCGSGLMLETLHYADEIRKAAPFFAEIGDDKADSDLLSVAEELIGRKTAPFDASHFKDHYRDALRALIDQRLKGKAPKIEAEETRPSGDNVVDLMGALKRSLEGEGGRGRKGSSSSSSSGSKRSGSSSSRKASAKKSASSGRGRSGGKARKSA